MRKYVLLASFLLLCLSGCSYVIPGYEDREAIKQYRQLLDDLDFDIRNEMDWVLDSNNHEEVVAKLSKTAKLFRLMQKEYETADLLEQTRTMYNLTSTMLVSWLDYLVEHRPNYAPLKIKPVQLFQMAASDQRYQAQSARLDELRRSLEAIRPFWDELYAKQKQSLTRSDLSDRLKVFSARENEQRHQLAVISIEASLPIYLKLAEQEQAVLDYLHSHKGHYKINESDKLVFDKLGDQQSLLDLLRDQQFELDQLRDDVGYKTSQKLLRL